MVDVKEDSEDWKVILSFRKDDCPHGFHPVNMRACKHPIFNWKPHQDFIECTLENCPAKL